MRDSTTQYSSQYFQTGLLLAMAGTALFGLKSIFIKLAYQQGVDTTTLLTLRMLIAFPFYLGMLFWLLKKPGVRLPGGRQLLAIAGLGFLGYYLSSLLDMQGLNLISAQLERLTLYTYPLFTTLLGWLLLREVVSKNIWWALLATYSGVFLIYAQEASLEGTKTGLGVLLVVGAALSYSCYLIFSKGIIATVGSRMFTSLAMLASTGYVLIHFAATRAGGDLQINQSAWIYAALLAFISTLIPSYLVSEAIARIGAARTSIIGTAGPVFTIVLAIIILGEPFGWHQSGGMVLVLFGVALLRK